MATTILHARVPQTQVTASSSNADYHHHLPEGHGRVAEYRTEAEIKAAYLAVRKRLNPVRTSPIHKKVNITDSNPPTFEQVVVVHWRKAPEIFDHAVDVQPPLRVCLHDIKTVIMEEYGISPVDLISDRRCWSVVMPRQITMWLARTMTPLSLPAIGRALGKRDHTTVLSAYHRIERLRLGHPEAELAPTDDEKEIRKREIEATRRATLDQYCDAARLEGLQDLVRKQAETRMNPQKVVQSDSAQPVT